MTRMVTLWSRKIRESDAFGVLTNWEGVRRFALLASLSGVVINPAYVWSQKYGAGPNWDWSRYVDIATFLASGGPVVPMVAMLIVAGDALGAWRLIRALTPDTVRAVVGVRPDQAANFRRWRVGTVGVNIAAYIGLAIAYATLPFESNVVRYTDAIFYELNIVALTGTVVMISTIAFAKVLSEPTSGSRATYPPYLPPTAPGQTRTFPTQFVAPHQPAIHPTADQGLPQIPPYGTKAAFERSTWNDPQPAVSPISGQISTGLRRFALWLVVSVANAAISVPVTIWITRKFF
jgi:hypothetical protein